MDVSQLKLDQGRSRQLPLKRSLPQPRAVIL